jgi:hypothetical protein
MSRLKPFLRSSGYVGSMPTFPFHISFGLRWFDANVSPFINDVYTQSQSRPSVDDRLSPIPLIRFPVCLTFLFTYHSTSPANGAQTGCCPIWPHGECLGLMGSTGAGLLSSDKGKLQSPSAFTAAAMAAQCASAWLSRQATLKC